MEDELDVMEDELVTLIGCIDAMISEVHDILQKTDLKTRWCEIFSKQLDVDIVSDEKVATQPATLPIYTRYVMCCSASILKICLETYNQTKSLSWFKHRKMRISATKAYDICQSRIEKWPYLPKKFLTLNFQNEAMTYGLQNEKVALESFIRGNEHQVLETGLIVCYRQPWLCCSPDGLFFKNSELVLLEIKCPYSCRNNRLIDFKDGVSNVYYLFIKRGSVFLKKGHRYYSQIQIQLYVTGAAYCLLYVYSNKQQVVVRIDPDPAYWLKAIPKLERFYFKFYLPYIYKQRMLQ